MGAGIRLQGMEQARQVINRVVGVSRSVARVMVTR